MTDASSLQLPVVVPTSGNSGPRNAALAVVAVTQEVPPVAGGSSVAALPVIVVMNETPPRSGGAQINGAAIVMVQIEYKQPERRIQLPLITAPNAFPLFIARVD